MYLVAAGTVSRILKGGDASKLTPEEMRGVNLNQREGDLDFGDDEVVDYHSPVELEKVAPLIPKAGTVFEADLRHVSSCQPHTIRKGLRVAQCPPCVRPAPEARRLLVSLSARREHPGCWRGLPGTMGTRWGSLLALAPRPSQLNPLWKAGKGLHIYVRHR